jgi:hypothetical protein
VDIDIQHIFRIAKNAKVNSQALLTQIKETYIAANGLGVSPCHMNSCASLKRV